MSVINSGAEIRERSRLLCRGVHGALVSKYAFAPLKSTACTALIGFMITVNNEKFMNTLCTKAVSSSIVHLNRPTAWFCDNDLVLNSIFTLNHVDQHRNLRRQRFQLTNNIIRPPLYYVKR
jgi:hypothetical protein